MMAMNKSEISLAQFPQVQPIGSRDFFIRGKNEFMVPT
jgi:hypothetical protein